MENWFKYLIGIDKTDKILAIAVRKNNDGYNEDEKGELFKSIEEAKKILDYDFDAGFGGENGPYFTAWTKDKVYFPVQYDGSEWITSVPRKICNIATSHKGGG